MALLNSDIRAAWKFANKKMPICQKQKHFAETRQFQWKFILKEKLFQKAFW